MRCPRVDAQLSSGLLSRCPSREHPYSLGPTPSPHTHLPPQLHAGPVPVCLPHTSTSDAPQSCGNRVTMHLEQATTSRHSVPGLAAITPHLDSYRALLARAELPSRNATRARVEAAAFSAISKHSDFLLKRVTAL